MSTPIHFSPLKIPPLKKSASLLPRVAAILLILIIFVNCSSLSPSPQQKEFNVRLARAQYFLNRGDYQRASQEYEQLLAQYPTNPSLDKILFSLGQLYGQPDNPQRDFKTSFSYFERLKTEFPGSSYTKQLQPWLNWLQEIISLEDKIDSLQTEIIALETELKKVTAEKIETEATLTAEISRQTKEISELENKIRQQNALIDNLKGQLEKIKEIDVLTEKKAQKR
jgi:outer membrane protein assembly factor BamD (BamD/ComL family)